MLSIFWERIFGSLIREVSSHCVISMQDDISMALVLNFPDSHGMHWRQLLECLLYKETRQLDSFLACFLNRTVLTETCMSLGGA